MTKRHRKFRTLLALTSLAVGGLAFQSQANEIPAQLPAPDGEPGDATMPVKVYILAGQSNMVGMGEVGGAKNMYSGMFLTSDPAAPIGPLAIFKVGNYKISPLAIFSPDGTGTDKPLAEGQLEVPENGVYQIHCSSGGVIELDGRPGGQDMSLDAGKRYGFKISGHQGDVPRIWMQKMDLLGHGDLESVAKREGKFPWLVDDKGEWTVRNDVYFQEARVAGEGKGSPLSATSNGKAIGPELGFGHVLGSFHDEQVLLIKTAMGNRALGFDFRPPSSGRNDPDSKWESLEYKLMVEGVRKTLDKIDKVVPGYKGQGYEIVGFVWFQGHKDSFTPELITEYEKNLTNLINDVRKEFKAPKMPAVVATVGFHGHDMDEKFTKILEAQMAVGDPDKHPEFAGNVSSVDTRDFWREVDESPTNQDYHYNRNAETYMLVGDALGRAMVKLQGGQAAPLPQPARPKRAVVDVAAELTSEQKDAAQAALTPIVIDGIIPAYVANPRNNKALVEELRSERPDRVNQFLNGMMFGLENCYRAIGIDDYDWHVFGPVMKTAEWQYFSFDPEEKPEPDDKPRYRKVSYPAGMENWAAPGFDATAAGWKNGRAPFGQLDGKLEPLSASCTLPFCGCGGKPATLWENEVLLMRQTFEIPPLREGHRYRLVVGGSAHVNKGEGYAIFVNGKPLAESTRGVGKREGAQPRGGLVHVDLLDEFKSGKATIAATSFLKGGGTTPASGHFSVWMEEQKIPSVNSAP